MTVLIRQKLALQAQDGLQHGVARDNRLGVGLEAALGDDHVGQLLGQVNVGHFKRTGQELSLALGAALADIGGAAVD